MRNIIGLILMILSCIFLAIEMNYFGFNLMPESIFELECDLIGATVFIGGFLIFKSKK